MSELERLRELAMDVRGCWDAFEVGLRELIGNTNYNVVARKLAEALERDHD